MPHRLRSRRQSQHLSRLVDVSSYPATPLPAIECANLPPPRLLPASSPKSSLLATLLKSSISESMLPLLLRGVAGKAAASAVWDVLLAFLDGCCSAKSAEEMTAGVCSAMSSCLRLGAPRGGVVGVLRPPPVMTKGGTGKDFGGGLRGLADGVVVSRVRRVRVVGGVSRDRGCGGVDERGLKSGLVCLVIRQGSLTRARFG
jgi:hypothetical protein